MFYPQIGIRGVSCRKKNIQPNSANSLGRTPDILSDHIWSFSESVITRRTSVMNDYNNGEKKTLTSPPGLMTPWLPHPYRAACRFEARRAKTSDPKVVAPPAGSRARWPTSASHSRRQFPERHLCCWSARKNKHHKYHKYTDGCKERMRIYLSWWGGFLLKPGTYNWPNSLDGT